MRLSDRREQLIQLGSSVAVTHDSLLMQTVQEEWTRGVHSLTGQSKLVMNAPYPEASMVMGLRKDHEWIKKSFQPEEWEKLGEDRICCIRLVQDGDRKRIVLGGNTDKGILYGTFRLLMLIAEGKEPHLKSIRWKAHPTASA